jgi:hypothetical protein
MVPAMASNAACLMAIRTMSGIWGQAALVGSHRKSSGFVCGHEAGAFRCEWPPSIGRLMTTKPEAFSCATSLSATTLDMVSADCVRASALPLVKASASAVSTSRGSAGVSLSSMVSEGTRAGEHFKNEMDLVVIARFRNWLFLLFAICSTRRVCSALANG